MKKILITGGGYIGTSLRAYLSEHETDSKVDVISLRHDDWRAVDFSTYDVICHTAGIAHPDRGKITPEQAGRYYAVNLQLTMEVAEKAKREGVGQFLFFSSAIVYGDSAPVGQLKMITAETIPSPANCYGDSKLQAESRLLQMRDETFCVAILRLPMVYGKGSKGNYSLLARMAVRTPVFPDVKNCRSMLYIENLCEFVRLVIRNEDAGIFWPQNEEYVCTAELVQMIAEVHGKHVRLVKWLVPFVKVAGCFTGLVNKAFGSLAYDYSLSVYQDRYQVCTFKESVRRTEAK